MLKKLRRMAKHYPEKKVVVVDRDAYRAIAKQVKGLVQYWEIG